jgi:hypothetical protein
MTGGPKYGMGFGAGFQEISVTTVAAITKTQ